MKNSPLAGLKVIDFSRIIAGPLCTQQLADLGARVIKIEHPVTGDDGRSLSKAADDRGAFFQAYNRSKESIALDLTQQAAIDIVHQLLEGADILVENFRPGVMKRLGLDYETLSEKYPRLIYLSVSAYGQTGMMADRPGMDPVLQAEFGMMSMTGEPDGPPVRTPQSLIDTMTAMNATTAVLAAVLTRQQTGCGERIELSLMATAVSALGNLGLAYLNSGHVTRRAGNQHPDAAPVNLFRTATQPIYAALATQKLFVTFCKEVLRKPEWVEDARFATPAARSRNRQVFYTMIDEVMMEQPAEYWLERMRSLPSGAVRSIDEALDSPEVAEQELIMSVPDDSKETVRMFRLPMKFSRTQVTTPTSAPHLGEQGPAILAELGYGPAEIEQLIDRGVLRPYVRPENAE
ncbi:MAG: CoA transferase [Pseudomonadales bacterium]|nr:CoA transferase [Pseudomonadales bacterium]